MRATDLINEPCSIARPVAILGDRWMLILLRQAFLGIRRFDDFHTTTGMSRSSLADRLTALVDAGILRRAPYHDGVRMRDEYRLTEKGIDLYPILRALAAWGDKYLAENGPFVRYTHSDCGAETSVSLRCDGCGAEVTAREVTPMPGPGTNLA